MTDHAHNHRKDVECSKFCPQWLELFRHGDKNIFVDEISETAFNQHEGEKIVDSRRGVYGDPALTYIRVAAIISAIIDHEVSAAEAALIQVAVKLVRTAETPDYSDNSDDIIGYMKMFQEIVGSDMVHAKSVTEYLEKKS